MRYMNNASSRKAFAVLAVVMMCAAALVTVAYAYSATYKDTVSEKEITEDFVTITGDLGYPGDDTVVKYTANTETDMSSGTENLKYSDEKLTIGGTVYDVTGKSEYTYNVPLGTLTVTNHGAEKKDVYYGVKVYNYGVTTGKDVTTGSPEFRFTINGTAIYLFYQNQVCNILILHRSDKAFHSVR